MGEEQKKGQEEAMDENEEHVEEKEVNKGADLVEALNEVEIKKLEEETLDEIRDDTQATPLGKPTLFD